MAQQLLTCEESKTVARLSAAFIGYGDGDSTRTIQWLRKADMPEGKKYTNPTPNNNGVSGWCTLDGAYLRRVHVCAHYPCKARHRTASRYGETGPPDDHVRLYLPHMVHLAPTAPAPSEPPVNASPPSPPPPITVSSPTPTVVCSAEPTIPGLCSPPLRCHGATTSFP